jgi:chromosomal replication initiator protein
MNIVSIKELVITHFRVTSQQLRSRSRNKDYVDARRAMCYLLRYNTSLSLQQIGYRIGYHHSNVIHHINKAKGFIDVDTEFARKIKAIEEEINFKPVTFTEDTALKRIMEAIVWTEKGTTRKNLEKLLG